MNKKQLNVRKPQNNNAKLYKSLIESIAPEIKKIIKEAEEVDEDEVDECGAVEEGELNELFGFGSDVKKPEATLSVENTDEENAEIFLQYCEYYMDKAGSNIASGVANIMKVCQAVLVKAPVIVLKGILMVFSRAYKITKASAAKVAAIVVACYAVLVKLIKSGVKAADEVLTKVKDTLMSKAKGGYASFKKNTKAVVKEASDNFVMWAGIASAITMMVAEKLEGAADAFGDWVKSIIEDVKNKVEAAAMLVKTWLSTKSDAVKSYITETGKEIKTAAVEVWNKLDKEVRKAYTKVTETLEKWMGSLKDLVTEIGKKIDDAKEATKSYVIDKKDKALVYSIKKAVKGLSDKYKEDEVVALVRKAYNENLKPNANGEFFINECYFYDRDSKKRKLYENHKKVIKRQQIFS